MLVLTSYYSFCAQAGRWLLAFGNGNGTLFNPSTFQTFLPFNLFTFKLLSLFKLFKQLEPPTTNYPLILFAASPSSVLIWWYICRIRARPTETSAAAMVTIKMNIA